MRGEVGFWTEMVTGIGACFWSGLDRWRSEGGEGRRGWWRFCGGRSRLGAVGIEDGGGGLRREIL